MKIEILVSPDGSKATVHVEGVKGPSCSDLTQALERALGRGERTERTREYFEQPPQKRRAAA